MHYKQSLFLQTQKKKNHQLPRIVKEKKADSICLFTVCSKYILESQHKTGKKKKSKYCPIKQYEKQPLMNFALFSQLPVHFSSVQFSRSVVSDSLRPHELQHARPPVHHQLPEFTQSLVHQVSDAIQPSHPLLSPSPPAHNPSQHQSLFQWVNSSHEVAKVLEFQL